MAASGEGKPKKTKVEVLADLGMASFKSGEVEKAIGFFEQGVAVSEKEDGQPCMASLLMNLAVCKGASGDMSSALPLLERALAVQEAELGEFHPGLLQPLQNLIVVCTKCGQTDKAVGYMQRAGEIEDKQKKAEAKLVEQMAAAEAEKSATGPIIEEVNE
eukprot:TRINITY_DN56594_c0_g1_i1.p1 TRINITY_DN56594_c0_g1~~TRINITY_DN56594_c0_g1_i1.p1  ORF type:complete len:188 (+),score=57.42 TRINITY_DN56594_c0_g1_i1:87-566(+)